MRRLSQYNKGWWNCFGSLVSELADSNPALAYDLGKRVVKGAGVNLDEAKAVLASDELPVVVSHWLSHYFNPED